MNAKTILAAALVSALTFAPALLAQQTPAGDPSAEAKPAGELQPAPEPARDPWQFTLTPLVWLAGIDGHVTLRGNNANVDVDFDQIFDHLNGGLMLYLELRKKKFGFFAQPNYMKLSAEGTAGPLSAGDTMKLWIVEGGGFYQIGEWGGDRPLTLDAIAGVQFMNLHNDLTLRDPGGTAIFKGSGTVTLIDPIIGLRAKKYLTAKLSVNIQGDVGGFGISSDSSDLTWQAVGTLGYDFTKHFSLFAGYRALSVDNETGSGVNRKGADLLLSGAILGLAFHW